MTAPFADDLTHVVHHPTGDPYETDTPPVEPPNGETTETGQWEYWDEERDYVVVKRHWLWGGRPAKTPEQIAYEYAKGLQEEVQGIRDQLNLDGLSQSVAKLDPSAIRQPAGGFDVMGVTVIGQSELNSTREALADVAEALQSTLATFVGTTAALDRMIDTSSAVLDAIPQPATVAATATIAQPDEAS